MTIRKAVIPVAGFGTRMLPAAKAVPKEMLPIIDRPVIQYVVEEAAGAGINEALLVTGRDKRAIEDHFDTSAELEARLTATGKQNLLESIHTLAKKVKVMSVRQPRQHGLGDAVNQARAFAGNEAVLVMLGDTIFSGSPSPAAQLIAAAEEFGTSVIGLEEVPKERVSRYGIAGGEMVREGVMHIDRLVEKPGIENAPSRYAIAARYVLTPAVFDCLDQTHPGRGDEIQLTDAMQLLLSREKIHGVILKSKRHDVGNPLDWLKTNLFFASRDKALWNEIEPTIRALLK